MYAGFQVSESWHLVYVTITVIAKYILSSHFRQSLTKRRFSEHKNCRFARSKSNKNYHLKVAVV